VKRFLSALLIAPIRLYQRFISPAFGQRCRYYPTCSEYAAQSIRELGPVRGSILAGYRLLRCTPFHRGGIDEIADRKLFRNTPSRSGRPASPSKAATNTAAASSGGSNGADLT
jgi:uncharacterized protein